MSDDISIPNPGYTGRRAGRYGRTTRTPLSPDSKRLLLYAGGLGGLLVAMVTASMLTSHRNGPVPVVEADSRPLRVKPENPGGLKIDAADSEVFSGGSDTANAKLAPPAEAPNPNGLQALPKPKPAPLAQAPAAPAPNAAKPAAVTAEPAAPAKSVMPAAKPAVVAKELPPPGKPVAATSATPAAPSPAAPAAAAAKDAAAAKPTVVASASAPASAAAAAKPASGHGATVQLAALGSEQAAREEWQKLQKQMPDMFGGRQPTIVKAERDGRTFWRLRAAGFNDVAQARGFCEKVRGKGGSCSVADF